MRYISSTERHLLSTNKELKLCAWPIRIGKVPGEVLLRTVDFFFTEKTYL